MTCKRKKTRRRDVVDSNLLEIFEDFIGDFAVEDLVIVPEVRGDVQSLEGLLA